MRKYILSVLVFFGLFILSGCGGGSDNISNGTDTISTTAIEATLNEMEINGDTFNLNILFTKKVDSSYQIELNNFNLSTDSCTLTQVPTFTPDVLNMDGGLNSFATVNIAGTFDQNCASTGYTFSATQTSTKDGEVDIRMFSVTYSTNDTGGVVTLVPSSGFFNATTPLEITQVDTPYKIKVQMVEEGYVAVGKTVIMKPFTSINDANGSVSSYTATTGADGYAVFNYTSPDPLPANGTSITLELTHDDNGTIITQDIVLNFNNTGAPVEPPVDTSNYLLQAVPSEINISTEDTSRVLDLYLSDTNLNAPVVGYEITAQFVDPNNGILDRYSVITDATGHATFKYTRPETFTVGNTFNITFEIEGTVPKSTTVGVTFIDVNAVAPVDTSNYVLQAVPATVNISPEETSKVLDLYLSDTNLKAPVVGQEITAQFVNPVYGQLDRYTATTDATGHVSFNYIVREADPFPVGDTFDIIFDVRGGTVPKAATVGVTFVAADFDYTLVNATTPLLITSRGMDEEISVYLVDSNNVGISGKTLTISTIADGYGSVSSSTATTDASGKATFNYTAPDDITGLVGTSTVATLRFTENETTISDNVTIMISSAAIISDYRLVNPAPEANITTSKQTAVLDIQLVHTIDGKEIPVIDARPCETVQNTVTRDCVIPQVIPREYGRITNAAGSNTDDGYIYFDYEGPDESEAAVGLHEFEVYYIDENGEIAATNTLSVDVNIPIP